MEMVEKTLNYIIPIKKPYVVKILPKSHLKCFSKDKKELERILQNNQNLEKTIIKCISILRNMKNEINKLRKIVKNKRVDDREYRIIFDRFVELIEYLSRNGLINNFENEIKVIPKEKYIIIREMKDKKYVNYILLKNEREIREIEI
jgi:hypothetical protein